MGDSPSAGGSRHSILDLAPLELDCMNALWRSDEASVRQVQEALRPTRPRAYTTIMTILDRLAQKGIVQRRKLGRAWIYRANVSADQARSHAVSQVVDGFFGGSAGALATHLTSQSARMEPIPMRLAPATREPLPGTAQPHQRKTVRHAGKQSAAASQSPAHASLDTALL